MLARMMAVMVRQACLRGILPPMRNNAMVLAVLLLAPGLHQAQQWEVFDMNTAGFPSNRVHCLAQDGQGRIWAGTSWGLCVRDGEAWTVLQTGNSGLPSNIIHSLHVDAWDRIWVGTVDAGMAMYDGSDWTLWDMGNSPLPDDQVNAIATDQQGRVYVATPNGLAVMDDGAWYLYNDSPDSHNGYQFFGKHMRDVAVGPDGTVAVVTMNGGFACFNDQEFICYTSYEHGFPDNSGYAIAFDQQGDRWLGTPAAGVVHHAGPILGGLWFMYSTQTSPMPENTVRAIAVDATGRKIIGLELSGLAMLNAQGNWSTFNSNNSDLPDDEVLALLVDEAGDLWVGTRFAGVARYAYAVGTADIEAPPAGLMLWPNPAMDRLQVAVTDPGPVDAWRMFDASGRLVDAGNGAGISSSQLDVTGLPAGTYLLQVVQGNRSMHGRFVKR
jgi:ligand-binding sensor domain-containing protein